LGENKYFYRLQKFAWSMKTAVVQKCNHFVSKRVTLRFVTVYIGVSSNARLTYYARHIYMSIYMTYIHFTLSKVKQPQCHF